MTDKSAADWAKMNDPVIKSFRTKAGETGRKHPVILLTTTGRKTGEPRVTPLNFLDHDGQISVIASSGGASRHPAWYRNLVDDPEVTIEHAGETFRARARTVDEPERTRLFDLQAAEMPFFDGYRKRVKTREIPVVAFDRID